MCVSLWWLCQRCSSGKKLTLRLSAVGFVWDNLHMIIHITHCCSCCTWAACHHTIMHMSHSVYVCECSHGLSIHYVMLELPSHIVYERLVHRCAVWHHKNRIVADMSARWQHCTFTAWLWHTFLTSCIIDICVFDFNLFCFVVRWHPLSGCCDVKLFSSVEWIWVQQQPWVRLCHRQIWFVSSENSVLNCFSVSRYISYCSRY